MLNLECDYKLEGDTLYRLDIFRSLNIVDILIISLFNMCKLKMAIIQPTGQWYAPSAVINDAWDCMV